MPSRALLVTNEFGEILICVTGPFIVPGCDTSDGRSPAGVCWRALQQAAQSFDSKNPLRGCGVKVCTNRVEDQFIDLVVTQSVRAVRLGDSAVYLGNCEWVPFTLLEDVPMPWRLQRIVQFYGQRFKLLLQRRSRAHLDSSNADDGSFASSARQLA